MRLQDLNWFDVENYLKTDNRIILITGATEQHAYLSLWTDILIPSRIALAVAEHEKILIAPAFNFGVSDSFADFPGTISIARATFDAVLCDVVEGLMQQGFGGFLILNGHGDNKLPQCLQDFAVDGLAKIIWFNWWEGNAAATFQAKHGLKIDHANWGENFPFTRVADVPETPKPLVDWSLLDQGQSMRAMLGDGSYGGLYQVSNDLMSELFMMVVGEAIELAQTVGH